jgi:feruloyl esterase
MPVPDWSGRYLGVTNGRSGGSIPYISPALSNAPSMTDALRHGFAVASTDTGPRAPPDDFSFGRGHPEKRIDYYYRAVHEMTVAAKAVIHEFYGAAPKYSYFMGCSDGGRRALMEAQRYPSDYQGVLACAPTVSRTAAVISWVWVAQALTAEPGSQIPENKIPAIQASAVAACDALDGLKDGIIGNAAQCRFDPAVLLCQGEESAECLTKPQVTALRKIYSGPRNSKGEQLAPGFPPGA